MTPRETDETPDTPWTVSVTEWLYSTQRERVPNTWLLLDAKGQPIDLRYSLEILTRIVAAINSAQQVKDYEQDYMESEGACGPVAVARLKARIRELEALPPRSPEGSLAVLRLQTESDQQFALISDLRQSLDRLEGEKAALTKERDEYKTLCKIGEWHQFCRPNRHQAAKAISDMSIVEGKLIDTITELRAEQKRLALQLRIEIDAAQQAEKSIERLEGEKAALQQNVVTLAEYSY